MRSISLGMMGGCSSSFKQKLRMSPLVVQLEVSHCSLKMGSCKMGVLACLFELEQDFYFYPVMQSIKSSQVMWFQGLFAWMNCFESVCFASFRSKIRWNLLPDSFGDSFGAQNCLNSMDWAISFLQSCLLNQLFQESSDVLSNIKQSICSCKSSIFDSKDQTSSVCFCTIYSSREVRVLEAGLSFLSSSLI